MHYQVAPATEAKLVRCTAGAIVDTVADMRDGSSTRLQALSLDLHPENRKALYVPPMFAHGYQARRDGTRSSTR